MATQKAMKPTPPKKQPAKKAAPKKKLQVVPTPGKEKPLPPPVPVAATAAAPGSNADQYGLQAIFEQSQPGSQAESAPQSAVSSTSEPKPGEPLSAEAEDLLQDLTGESGGAAAAAPPIADAGLSLITFDESYVRDVLEECYGWLSEKFESDHWLLSERQSRMLSKPTTQLLTSLWGHLQRLLPEILERWSQSTPGLMDFVMVFALVNGPKVARQLAITRQRKAEGHPQKRPQTAAGPQPVQRPHAGPVGPIEMGAAPLGFEGVQ